MRRLPAAALIALALTLAIGTALALGLVVIELNRPRS
jgi:hypothetical protein